MQSFKGSEQRIIRPHYQHHQPYSQTLQIARVLMDKSSLWDRNGQREKSKTEYREIIARYEIVDML